ncbi:preprotein translocase subunit SecE [Parasphingorhabdus sp.]|uniref:preprotein translocase subunit SecE n=1 Tax=Parasphingorhabdus sp. TaxID=2709688 RepID=UPI003593D5DA
MAKVNPGEFMNQVKAETNKVVWPTWPETVRTAILVLIMTTILGLFFLAIDSVFNGIVAWLLSLA